MEQRTKLDTCEVVSFDLTKEQHDIAVELVEYHPFWAEHTLEEVDPEMANVWIADAFGEGNDEYAHFLQKAIADGADLYTLKDDLQSLGEVAIYFN